MIVFFFLLPSTRPAASLQHVAHTDTVTLLLFPQFGFAAQKQEALCRMLSPGASRQALKMKDGSGGLVLFPSDSEATGASTGLIVFKLSAVVANLCVCVCVLERVWLLPLSCWPALYFLLCGTSSVLCRQKEKERKSRLSLFLTKSGSHENVSPQKKKPPPANK